MFSQGFIIFFVHHSNTGSNTTDFLAYWGVVKTQWCGLWSGKEHRYQLGQLTKAILIP
jgi:hypothetical protein